MDSVIRGLVVYFFVLIVFRIAGKRTLSQINTFDLVLTLIISETLQQALIDDDNSMTNAMLLVLTLVGLDIVLSILKHRVPFVARLVDSLPIVIMRDGTPAHEPMKKERINDTDVLNAARQHQGISTMDDIDYAILEAEGHITIVPKEKK